MSRARQPLFRRRFEESYALSERSLVDLPHGARVIPCSTLNAVRVLLEVCYACGSRGMRIPIETYNAQTTEPYVSFLNNGWLARLPKVEFTASHKPACRVSNGLLMSVLEFLDRPAHSGCIFEMRAAAKLYHVQNWPVRTTRGFEFGRDPTTARKMAARENLHKPRRDRGRKIVRASTWTGVRLTRKFTKKPIPRSAILIPESLFLVERRFVGLLGRRRKLRKQI